MTWGNHDFIGERLPQEAINELLPDTVRVLVDEAVEIGGTGFWFSPWSNLFGGWAFMETEADLRKRYAKIPEDTEILVSHGPPKGYGDRIYWDNRVQNVGSQSLLDRFVALPACKHLICGHIHEAMGEYHLPRHRDDLPKAVWNVSQVNESYKPVYNAVRILEI
jgi:Icc-related predicted phosphoesterase